MTNVRSKFPQVHSWPYTCVEVSWEALVQVEDRVEDYTYGRFGWATDPEGNRFELWEPR